MKKRPNKFWSAAAFILLLTIPATDLFAAQAMDDYPVVRLQSLDKATARTMTFDARVGGTIKFGQIFIKVQACRKTPPIEQPESAAFLQAWEVTSESEPHWIFSGWMFASSPGLSSMDHPIYDVWVLDCLESGKTASASEAKNAETPAEELPAPETPAQD